MRRDPLELADDGLFIEIIKNDCTAVDTFLLTAANGFLKEGTFGFDPTPLQAIDQSPDCNADASTISDAFLAPLIFQDLFNPVKFENNSSGSSPLSAKIRAPRLFYV
jgi:hypothetical protein